jgi:hypothetical protein
MRSTRTGAGSLSAPKAPSAMCPSSGSVMLAVVEGLSGHGVGRTILEEPTGRITVIRSSRMRATRGLLP